MRIKIIEDTAISGTPVFVGAVMDVDEGTFRLLKVAGKAIAFPIVAVPANPTPEEKSVKKSVKKSAKKTTKKT